MDNLPLTSAAPPLKLLWGNERTPLLSGTDTASFTRQYQCVVPIASGSSSAFERHGGDGGGRGAGVAVRSRSAAELQAVSVKSVISVHDSN